MANVKRKMIEIDEEKCTGCKVCMKVCPHHVIEMIDKKAQAARLERCVECGACDLNCEFGAITVTKGTGCLFAIVREDILKIRGKGCGCGDGCC